LRPDGWVRTFTPPRPISDTAMAQPMSDGTASSFRVELFGIPKVLRAESSVRLSPLQLGLVAVVYGHGREGIARPRVAELLWREDAGADVRHRIRQLLVEVRSKTGVVLIESRGDDLAPLAGIPCDLREFERALERDDLLQAATLVNRGFCQVVGDGLADGFYDWRSAVHDSVSRRLAGRAAAKWSRGIESADWRSARDAAEALHVMDPRDPVALARLIEARGAAGDVEAAERAFAAYMESSVDAAAPDPAIRQAIGRARKLSRSLSNGQRSEPTAPLIGRREALASARTLFDQIAENRFGFVLVSGESGIGKTKLLSELHREALTRDVRCLAAQAVELESRIPLNPLIDALRGVDLQSHLTALGRPWSAVIGAVLPSGTLDEPAGELPPIQESALPRRLLDAFFLLLQRLANERPTVLFLDDLHWADATTVAALQFVQRRWASGPLGIMAAIRPELVSANDPVAKYLSNKDGLPIRRIDLHELSQDEAMQLVRFLGQGRVGEGRSRQICELACLHPLYLTELTRDYVAGRLTIPEQPVDAVSIPVSLEQILKSRFENLSSPAMKLAGLLAVAARPMRVIGLMALADLGLDDTTDAVEELRRARLVEADHDRVRISHDLFRSAIYRHIGDVRRAVNHRAIAQHILAEASDEAAGELAIHYARAGERELAARYGWIAAERAMETGTVAEAAHFYQLVSENEPLSSVRRAEATAGLARALHLGRDITRANPVLELAASALRAAGKPSEALRLEIKRVEGLAEVGAAPIATLVERLTQLKDEATRSSDWEAVALALDVELHLLHRAGDIDGIHDLFQQMSEISERGSAPAALLAHAGLALGVLYGDPDEALRSASLAVGIASDVKQHRLRALLRLMVALQYRGMLELPSSRPTVAEARALAERSGDVLMRFSIESNLAVALLDAGDLERAEIQMAYSTTLLGSADMDLNRFNQANNRAELLLAQHDFHGAEQSYKEASTYLGLTTPSYAQDLITAGLGICAIETGDLGEARRREEELSERPRSWYFDPTTILAFRVRLLDRRGRTSDALELLEASADDLRGRLDLAWLKARAILVRLMIRRKLGGATSIAQEAKERAEALCLTYRAKEFSALLDALGKQR
jgi:DNA-binding SARP family transcriptional activator